MTKQHIKVLLLENNTDYVQKIKNALLEAQQISSPSEQFKLVHADTLQQGLFQLSKEDFDVILLDRFLPDAESSRTLKLLYLQKPELPIIVIANEEAEEEEEEEEEEEALTIYEGLYGHLFIEQINGRLIKRLVKATTNRYHLMAQWSENVQESYKNIFEHNLDSIIVTDEKGKIFLLNRAAESLFGQSRKNLIGSLVGFPVAGGKTTELDILRDGKIFKGQMRVGEIEWNRKPAYVASIRDITDLRTVNDNLKREVKERKLTEHALRESEEKFRSLCDCSPVGIFLTDTNNKSTYMNQYCREICGFTSRESLRKGWTNFIHSDDRKSVVEDWSAHAKVGKAYNRELRIQRPGGSICLIYVRTSPVYAAKKKVIGHVGTVEDITERKLAEEKFEQVFESAPSAMIMVNTQGEIILVNKTTESLFGYERLELINAPIEKLIPAKFREKHQDDRNVFFKNPETRSMGVGRDLFGLRKDGTEVRVEIGLSTVKTQREVFVLASIVDITERKKTEVLQSAKELAEEANRMKSEFLANMSHEIRTPMNAILGFSELLNKTSLNATQKQYVDVLQSSGRILGSVINGILDISKFESGKMELEEIDFNLPYLVRDTLNMITVQIKNGLVKVFTKIDKSLPPYFKGDPTRIRQALLNLLSNALKFTSQGAIGIIIQKDNEAPGNDERLRFTVQDTGVGIAKKNTEKIFQPFEQADSSVTRKFGGTGLGLAITKSIVEAMGGTIWVESEEGKGSEFIFTVRLKKGKSPVHKDINPVTIEKVTGKKVLIVDDNKLSREILKKTCLSLKMHIVSLETSAYAVLETLKKLNEKKDLPDLILSDIRMEGMDGYEMAEKIGQNKAYNRIKMITLTSEVLVGQAKKSMEKGFDGYLSKPVNREDLVNVITAVLGDKRKAGQIVTRHLANELGCKGIKVLIVEDNKPNQMLMREYSKELGCESDFADNGREAVDKLKAGNQYDLVLMDFHMPVMGGPEACKIIRQEINDKIPIIALTAAVLEEDHKNAKAAGMNDFLTKPVNLDQLREKIIKYGRK